MTMKWWAAGFRSRNLQYTTRAGHSATETSGVGCARRQPHSRTLWKLRFSRFGLDVTGWGKSTVERGFGRKVAPGGAKIIAWCSSSEDDEPLMLSFRCGLLSHPTVQLYVAHRNLENSILAARATKRCSAYSSIFWNHPFGFFVRTRFRSSYPLVIMPPNPPV